MLVFTEGGQSENLEKNPWSKGENQQQTQLTYDTKTGNRTWVTVVRGKCSNGYATHASSTLTMASLFRYSVDQGQCWFSFEFTKEQFHLTGLVTSPGAHTMRVSLWGYNGTNRQWMVHTLNFRRVLEKKCKLIGEQWYTFYDVITMMVWWHIMMIWWWL
jgi:hypothetical protein